MADFGRIIRGYIGEYMKNAEMCEALFGKVVGINPLQVKIDPRLPPISEEALILTEAVIEKKIPVLEHKHTVEGSTPPAETDEQLKKDEILVKENGHDLGLDESGEYIIINKGLEVGDGVILMQCHHGQRFVIMSRTYRGDYRWDEGV